MNLSRVNCMKTHGVCVHACVCASEIKWQTKRTYHPEIPSPTSVPSSVSSHGVPASKEVNVKHWTGTKSTSHLISQATSTSPACTPVLRAISLLPPATHQSISGRFVPQDCGRHGDKRSTQIKVVTNKVWSEFTATPARPAEGTFQRLYWNKWGGLLTDIPTLYFFFPQTAVSEKYLDFNRSTFVFCGVPFPGTCPPKYRTGSKRINSSPTRATINLGFLDIWWFHCLARM